MDVCSNVFIDNLEKYVSKNSDGDYPVCKIEWDFSELRCVNRKESGCQGEEISKCNIYVEVLKKMKEEHEKVNIKWDFGPVLQALQNRDEFS
ncbi:MAG: hypothetical protein ACK4NF_05660, partial [Planctomycetota bacterium]